MTHARINIHAVAVSGALKRISVWNAVANKYIFAIISIIAWITHAFILGHTGAPIVANTRFACRNSTAGYRCCFVAPFSLIAFMAHAHINFNAVAVSGAGRRIIKVNPVAGIYFTSVAYAVSIRIFLVWIRLIGTIVARITCVVTVGISLVRIGCARAVVFIIRDAIAFSVFGTGD